MRVSELAGGRVIAAVSGWRRGPLWENYGGVLGDAQVLLRRRLRRLLTPIYVNLHEDVYVALRSVVVRPVAAAGSQFTEEDGL